MRILALVNAFGDGVSGVDVVARTYCSRLRREGLDIVVFSRTRTQKRGWMKSDDVPVYYVGTKVKRRSWSNIPYQVYAYFKKVKDTVSELKSLELKPKLVWLHYGTVDCLNVGFKAFPDIPKIVHVHGIWTRDFVEQFAKEFKLPSDFAVKPLEYLEEVYLKRADKIIVYSEWMKKLVENRAGAGKLVYTVYNPVDCQLFNPNTKPMLREDFGLRDEDTVVGYVGKFTPLKGTEYILKAAGILKSYKFVLVGREVVMPIGYYRRSAPSNVIFHPPIPHELVPSFMKMVDVYVQPTLRDGVEIPIAEALAMNKPVVASDHPERRLLYENSVYYCNPRDPEDLAEKMTEAADKGLLSDSDKIVSKFDVDKNVRELKAILR